MVREGLPQPVPCPFRCGRCVLAQIPCPREAAGRAQEGRGVDGGQRAAVGPSGSGRTAVRAPGGRRGGVLCRRAQARAPGRPAGGPGGGCGAGFVRGPGELGRPRLGPDPAHPRPENETAATIPEDGSRPLGLSEMDGVPVHRAPQRPGVVQASVPHTTAPAWCQRRPATVRRLAPCW